jgi:predicted enzyme related to lactoylglutathione lyase
MNGDVSFLELGSPEADTSKSLVFFAAIFGWQTHTLPQGGGWFQGPRIRVGLHGNDSAPMIYVFFAVPNLEAAMANVRHAGGHVDSSTAEEPNFGRFANCRDPLGIPFGLHQPPPS